MDYNEEKKSNEEVFMETLKNFLPGIHIIATQLQKTGVNPVPLFYVIKHIASICAGSRYGEVIIKIEDGNITFVKGHESSIVNEPGMKENL